MFRYVLLALKGCAMGMADVVPGVSGGTIAFISGIYSELIESIKSFNPTVCKTADVELASWERKLGGRLVTLIIQGDVSAVNEAVEAAVAGAIKKPASYAVIARPHEEIVKLVELSASRWKKKKDCEDETE